MVVSNKTVEGLEVMTLLGKHCMHFGRFTPSLKEELSISIPLINEFSEKY
jgi:hypothetical protein